MTRFTQDIKGIRESCGNSASSGELAHDRKVERAKVELKHQFGRE
jgi:hypothetical protein